jgi:hypothetical protein
MTPQSNFMVLADVPADQVAGLRTLLGTLNLRDTPGMADPNNSTVPFGKIESLHYARFVILDDQTLSDFKDILDPIPNYPIELAFLADFDGPVEEFLDILIQEAGPGLETIFAHCGFKAQSNLLEWMKRHSRRPAAAFVDWVGRTVKQIREEAALRDALVKYVDAHAARLQRADPQDVHRELIAQSRAVPLTPAGRTPFGWWLRNALHYAIVPSLLLLPWVLAILCLVPPPKLFLWVVVPSALVSALVFVWLLRHTPATLAVLVFLGLMLVPFFILFPLWLVPLVLAVLIFIWVLRRYEKSEPEIIFRPTLGHDSNLAALEDYDVGNQFTALGSVKPSAFRRTLFAVILWLTNYGARHVYTRGFLARIRSIHFARWVFIDDKRRVLFASNYDGSHQAYMDDFINKAGWGLNLAFGCGFGYPRTNWLIRDGSKEELKFKYTNRRHQVATQVWYKAYPGLTAFDLARNARVRQGVERKTMTDDDIRKWLSDL